ncbi:endonuclease/exonuclease/phosphatase family protein [Nocardioides pyridinolyticus]
MAERDAESVWVTVPIVLLLAVVIAAVVKLAHDDNARDAAPGAGPSARSSAPVAVQSATPADRGTPGSAGSTPPSATSTVCVDSDEATRLHVMTFNIHSARAADGSVRLSTITEEIRRWRADVVLLQEVDRGRDWTGRVDMPATLAEALGTSWTFGANVRRSATNQYGTAILSRFPITDSRNVPLPAPPGTQQRGLLGATIDVNGTEVSVYNTHLEHTSSAARLQQMRVITQVLASDPRPMVLGGDLNSRPGSPVMDLATRQLTDTWPEVGRGPGYTHSARNPRSRIDYLLHDGGEDADLVSVDAIVLRSGVSDHWAVRAGYRLVSDSGEICVPLLGGDDLP